MPYLPYGPYKEYDEIPEASKETAIDPRTNTTYGKYSEDEIADMVSKRYGTVVALNLSDTEYDNSPSFFEKYADTNPFTKEFKLNASAGWMATYKGQNLMSQANVAMSRYLDTRDITFKQEADRKRLEAQAEFESVPDQSGRGEAFKLVNGVMNVAGYFSGALSSRWKEMFGSTAIGAGSGALAGAAATAAGLTTAPIWGTALTVGGFAFGSQMAADMEMQGRGEIYYRASQLTDGEDTMPDDIAESVARKWSVPYAMSEQAGMLSVARYGSIFGSSVAKRLESIAIEEGTETVQEIIAQFAEHEARKEWAKRRGIPFNESFSDVLDWHEVQENARLAVYSAAGIGMGSAALRAPKELSDMSAEVQRTVLLREQERLMLRRADSIIRKEQELKKIVEEASAAPLTEEQVASETSATNTLVDPVEIQDEEKLVQLNNDNIRGTNITDDEVKHVSLLRTDEEVVAATEKLLDKMGSPEESTQADEFFAAIGRILPADQARAIEAIVDAHAATFGESANDYITRKNLYWENIDEDMGEVKAVINAVKDSRIIINAFQGADITTAIHELGHVFVTDITGKDKATLDKWVGVKKGTEWGRVEHEKFARGWERYLADEKPPVPELAQLFDAFSRWIINVYKAIAGSDIDVKITPAVKKVFDRLLVNEDLAKKAIDTNNFNGMTLEQRQSKPREEAGLAEEKKRMAAERTALRESRQEFDTELSRLKYVGKDAYGYTTSDGKRHLFDGSSSVTRTDKSITPKSSSTVFVSPADAEAIKKWKKEGGGKFNTGGNKLRLINKGKTGLNTVTNLIDFTDTPTVGFVPVAMKGNTMVLSESIKTVDSPINDRRTILNQMRALNAATQRAFDIGDQHGYNMLKAHMKALLNRHYNRVSQMRRHAAEKKYIKKLLRKAAAKVKNGRLQSGMSLRVYDQVKEVIDLIEPILDRDVVRMYQQYIVNGQTVMPLSPAEVLRNAYLDGAISRNKYGTAILKEVSKAIRDLVAYGRSESPYVTNMLVKNELLEKVMPEVHGGNVMDLTTLTEDKAYKQRKEQKKHDWLLRLQTNTLGHDFIFGLNGLMKLVTAYAGENGSTLARELSFFNEKQAKATAVRNHQINAIKSYLSIFGLESTYAFNKALNEDTRPQFRIGTIEEYQWSKSELRTLWMYMQDKNLDYRLLNMGVTDKVRKNVESILSDKDKNFAKALMQFYASDDMYNRINATYQRMFGISLPRIKNYVPYRSEALKDLGQRKADEKFSQFDHDSYFRKGPFGASSLMNRLKEADKAKLHIMPDMSLYNSYTDEMEHFIAYADKARLATAVITDKKFKSAVEIEYGPAVYTSLERALTDTLADSIDNRDNVPMIDSIRSALIVSQIGLSLGVTLKQCISIVNIADKMPVSSYLTGIAKFFAGDIEKNIALMRKTEYIENRKSSVDRDLKNILYSPEYKRFKLNPSLTNFLTLNVTFGDAVPFVLGGWVYQDYLQTQVNPATGVNYTETEAINTTFEEFNKTQQSGDIQELSRLQRGNSYARLFTMYSTGPIQAVRQELEAVRDRAAGRISTNQLVKTLFIYHVLVPAMYSMAGSIISGDDSDDKYKNLALSIFMGPFGSSYSAGRFLYSVMRGAFNMNPYQDLGPMADAVHRIGRFGKKVAYNPDTLKIDDYAKAMESTLALLGYGIPLARITRTGENLVKGDFVGAAFSTNPNR